MRKIIIGLMLAVAMPLSPVLLPAQPAAAEPNGCRGYEDNPCGGRRPGPDFCWVFLCTTGNPGSPFRPNWPDWFPINLF